MGSLTTDSKGRSPYWICCYTSATGQRLKKSTKVTVRPLPGEKRKDGTPKTAADKRTEAHDFCRALEIAENSAKAGSLTEQAAKKLIGEIIERTSGEVLKNQTISEWLTEWQAGKEDTKAESTANRYAQVVKEFLESLGKRSNLSIAHITPKDIRAYRETELAAGNSNNTANDAVRIVSTAFNAALRQGYITNNPCLALESLPEETAERSTFTTEQVAKLVSTAEGDWRNAILFAYYTGARLGDVANISWNVVDFEKRLITFTPRKTKRSKRSLVIPLHSDLERVLVEKPGVGRDPIFPLLVGRKTGGKTGLSGQFSKIMLKAGITGTVTRHTAGGRANNNLSFHSLRHSFNSAMANAGVVQEIRQKLTGHTSAKTNKIYTHHELDPLVAAIKAIPSVNVSTA